MALFHLEETIEAINNLMDIGDEAALTYAALECRLAIERICYSHLKQHYSHLTAKDLAGWTPAKVVTLVVEKSSDHIKRDITISIKNKNGEYQQIGTQKGIDIRELGRAWNALSNLALHTKLPVSKDEQIRRYGPKDQIAAKVADCITLLKEHAKASLVSSGLEHVTSLECGCGETTKVTLTAVKNSAEIHCSNAECDKSYRFSFADRIFKERLYQITCEDCGAQVSAPAAKVDGLTTQSKVTVHCPSPTCQAEYQFSVYLEATRLE